MGVFSRRTTSSGSATTPTPLHAISGSAQTRTTNPKSLPFTTHRSMTAAAALVDISTAEGKSSYARRRTAAQGWQDEAWLYFDAIGEISYAFTVVANALSRVRLYTAHVVDPSAQPVPADPDNPTGQASIEILDRLNSAFGGIPGLLRDAAMNIQVSGEALLVQRPANPFATPPQPESWDIFSTDELSISQDGGFVITPREDGDKSANIPLPKNAFVARIWRPHPRFSDTATSSMRPILDLCAELVLLNKTFRSTERSRLNSGLLYLPDGLSVAASPDPDAFATNENELDDPDSDMLAFDSAAHDAADQSDTDEFEEALIEAMITPISDEESASAVVPLIVRGPADLGEKIRLIQFERSFDPSLAERAGHVLDRIMQGLDVPKEIVKGLSSLKFSTASIVDIQLYQAHVEPLALLICDALTTIYLRPALRSLGLPEDEVRKHVIWYDPTDVTTRPNRAEDADTGFDKHLIGGQAWRRAHNFTDDDAPTSTELAVRMLLQKGPITPELAEALLTIVAPDMMNAVRDAAQAANPAPMPDDVSNILNGEVPEAGSEPEPEPAAEESPIPPIPPVPPPPPPTQPAPIDTLPGEENLI